LESLRKFTEPSEQSERSVSLSCHAVPGLPVPGRWSWLQGRRSSGVKQMSIGLEHACFVTRRGELFCVGGNEWGQCGQVPPVQKGLQGALEERVRHEVMWPHRVSFPEDAGKIDTVAVGGRHSVAMDVDGRAYAFGDDRRIQLGLGDTRSQGVDDRHAYGVLNRDHLGGVKPQAQIKRRVAYRYYDPHMQAAPAEVIPPVAYNRPAFPQPSYITCGEDFTIAIHRDSPDWYSDEQETNLVFCCGENGVGQCGRNLQQQQQVWLAAKLPKHSRTTNVVCGQGHCMALLTTGKAYAWGENLQGTLGKGGRANSSTPLLVDLPGTVVSVACGFRNSAAICEVPAS